MSELQQISWPLAQLGEAMMALAHARGLRAETEQTVRPPAQLEASALNEWVEAAADYLGLEAEPVEVAYNEIETLVQSASPLLLQLPDQRVLALLKGTARTVTALTPNLQTKRVPTAAISNVLRAPHEAPLHAGLEQIITNAKLSSLRGQQAKQAILREQLSAKIIGGGWLLRLSPRASFWQQLQHAGLSSAMFTPIAWHLVHYMLLLAAWGMLGRGALQGQLELGWFAAWALLLATAVPFHLLAVRAQGHVAIAAGALLKQRLLYGALRLNPETIRHQGTGQLLGQVAEANAIETLALNGGFQAVVATIELTMALLVLGAGGARFALLLGGYLVFVLWLAWRYWQRRKSWTATRLKMTNDLVERMVGHRTRIAQESRERWHESEDQSLARYLTQSLSLDRADIGQAVTPRGWLLLGLAGIALTFVADAMNATTLAILIGGVLLAMRGLQKLGQSLQSLLGAALAWQQIAGIFRAAESLQTIGAPDFIARPQATTKPQTTKPVVVAAHDLAFRYQDRGNPVLRGCTLQIQQGDRVLLQGVSGGGKSTLASLLAGWRKPESGLLLVDGLDYETIGALGWRKRVVAAPQFHENHIITGTFAFNVLLGRSWPPTKTDWEQAEAVCRALGLGELLERMPAGMLQMIGETGWQLSHGERSRVFLARAILQDAELVILDESFGALDPATMQKSLQCVLERVPTLCVIAHP